MLDSARENTGFSQNEHHLPKIMTPATTTAKSFCNSLLIMLKHALKGLVNNIQTIPMENI